MSSTLHILSYLTVSQTPTFVYLILICFRLPLSLFLKIFVTFFFPCLGGGGRRPVVVGLQQLLDGLQTNGLNDRSCTWGMIYTNIRDINPGFPLQCSDLKTSLHSHFISISFCSFFFSHFPLDAIVCLHLTHGQLTETHKLRYSIFAVAAVNCNFIYYPDGLRVNLTVSSSKPPPTNPPPSPPHPSPLTYTCIMFVWNWTPNVWPCAWYKLGHCGFL